MTRGVRWSLVGSLVLVALGSLVACKQSWLEEREPWRREAEVECLKSGTVKESPSVALLGPINGPGMCGADFPLKVAALGEQQAPLGYADEPIRPPGPVPQAGNPYPRPVYTPAPTYRPLPQYPASEYPPNTPFSVNPAYPADTRLPPNPDYRPSAPVGPQRQYPQQYPTQYPTQYPQQQHPAQYPQQYPAQSPSSYPGEYSPPPPYETPYRPAMPNGPVSLTPPGIDPGEADAEGAYQTPLPNYGAPRTVPAREPRYRPEPRERAMPPRYPGSSRIVPLSPSRDRMSVATTASVTPTATLACPIVSALDRWITEAVQPAAQKWFGQPVTEIKQISAYSCRGMNGNSNARISEHAFGNALDIAAFILADGQKITVKNGWRGTPEEQGFLRDVQGAACEQFTTVLAPGSNVYHYDHIHVDLMRRASGRRICQPGAVSGDLVAERVRARYAASREPSSREPSFTGSIRRVDRSARRGHGYSAYEEEDRSLPDAVPGED